MEWYNYPDWNNYRDQYSFAIYPVNGDDIPVPYNTPISAIFPGTVSSEYYDASGATLIIKADDPTQLKGIPYYYYAHLDSFNVSQGQHVAAGQQIGLSGGQLSGGQHPASPQYSSGPHIMIGESKTGSIPYTLQDLTTDLNPRWILDYARGSNIVTNPGNTISGTINLNTTTNTSCACNAPDTIVTIGGEQYCRHALGNGTYSYKSCQVGGSGPTPLDQILQAIQNSIPWLSNPIRIIKLVSGIMLIGAALFLIASPQSQIAMSIAKGASKGGIR